MAISAVSFLFSSAAQPEAQGLSFLLSAGFLYHILSLTSLIPNSLTSNSIGGPEGPFGLVWLSLPHLASNSYNFQLSDFLSWPSYIIVQRPLNRSLNLWNGTFDRHQAEITVMQFRGHSLPVHQSMSVSWAFTLSHFVSQIRQRDFFRSRAIGMCHFLPVHHFGMAFWPGRRSKYNTIEVGCRGFLGHSGHFVSFKNRNHWLQFESCLKSSSDRGAICIKLDLVESEIFQHE